MTCVPTRYTAIAGRTHAMEGRLSKVPHAKARPSPKVGSAPTIQPNAPRATVPPVYRPHTPQAKLSTPQPYCPRVAVPRQSFSAPPVYRPTVPVQARMSASPSADRPPRPGNVHRGRSSVINMMPEVGTNAMTSLLTYDYSLAEATLYADEKTELDDLWSTSYVVTRNTSKPVKRQRARAAADTVKARLDQMLAVPKVTYSANFTTNHLSDGDVARTTAKTRGESRNPVPPHNTVLKESYLRGLLQADASARADGTYWLRFQSPHSANGKISLATRNGGSMRAEDPGLYFVAVRYTLTTTAGAKRPKTVNAFHIETDDD